MSQAILEFCSQVPFKHNSLSPELKAQCFERRKRAWAGKTQSLAVGMS